MKILIFIVILFATGAFFIIAQNNLALREEGSIDKFYSLYINWMGEVFDNSFKATSYVVKMDWLPENTG